MTCIIGKLPECIEKEILHFIIPDSNSIQFRRESPQMWVNRLYEIAFIGDSIVQNKKEVYLSRLYKKNGKHRYYLTKKTFDYSICRGCGSECCYSRGCRGGYDDFYSYKSIYVGKNINKALIDLLC